MAEQAAEGSEAKSNKLVIILIVLVVLLVGMLGAGAAWYFLMREDPAAQQALSQQSQQKKEAIYVKLRTMGGKPYFIANFSKEQFGTQRFLQVFAEARTRDPEVKEALQKHMPLIVHRLSTLFSSQTLSDMQTAEGKERLRTESTEIVKGIMQEEIGKPGIEEVFFTNFVMQ